MAKPGKTVGSFSIHSSEDEQEIINSLGWIDYSASTVYSESLILSEKMIEIGKIYEKFLSGEASLGEIMKNLNQIRSYTK